MREVYATFQVVILVLTASMGRCRADSTPSADWACVKQSIGERAASLSLPLSAQEENPIDRQVKQVLPPEVDSSIFDTPGDDGFSKRPRSPRHKASRECIEDLSEDKFDTLVPHATLDSIAACLALVSQISAEIETLENAPLFLALHRFRC
jgi:hypothetical protein